FRRSTSNTLDYTIVRGRIPIHSIDVGYMAAPGIGYIKISHFAENTFAEFSDALEKLLRQGASKLILDLRGNPGGYLNAAIQIADEFLPKEKLVVYTEGRARSREDYFATDKGEFEKGDVVILIDEGSASASEIVSGALQDWDRATLVGRRSFGKGLVQEQSELADGSAIRLTVARYYTPTGRSIQKPYGEDYASYENELFERLHRGELISADSIRFADSLKYTTPGGKVVYGGGGIMPDVFVPIDTDGTAGFYAEVSRSGLITQYAYDYLDKHRSTFEDFGSFDSFNTGFTFDEPAFSEFVDYARAQGVTTDEGLVSARSIIANQIKALIARQLWNNAGFYPVIHTDDKAFHAALDLLNGKRVAMKK
ncbi:MAG: S41 family peptidase, partial [Bacteroidota bacterium]